MLTPLAPNMRLQGHVGSQLHPQQYSESGQDQSANLLQPPPSTPPLSQRLPDFRLRLDEDCIVFGATGMYVSAVKQDLDMLLECHRQTRANDFPSFVKVWKSLKFSFIQFACRTEPGREPFLQSIFQYLLAALEAQFRQYQKLRRREVELMEIDNDESPGSTSAEQAVFPTGPVYAIYMIFCTQPSLYKKIRIKLTNVTWTTIEDIYQTAFDVHADHIIFQIRKLRQEHAFLLVHHVERTGRLASLDPDESEVEAVMEKRLGRLEQEVISTSMGSTAKLIDKLASIATKYTTAKEKLVHTPEAKIASKAVIATLEQSAQQSLALSLYALPTSTPAMLTASQSTLIQDNSSGETAIGSIAHPIPIQPRRVMSESLLRVADTMLEGRMASISNDLFRRRTQRFELVGARKSA